MSLATRCTACGTVFRVVQDQLRVSGGWVRCGRCGEVFNAVESLVDLDAPAETAPPSPHGERVMEELARVAGTAPTEPTTPAAVTPEPEPEPEPSSVAAPPPLMPLAAPTPSAPAVTAAATAPGFVRQADRAARWRRAPVRAALAVLALGLVALLGGQVHRSHHDWIAARWPATTPWLQRICALSGCTVEPPRRIESLAVESSGLVRGVSAGTFRLSVALRNRDRLALRVPAVDLTLTDAQGRVVARRVLLPAELGAGVTSVAGGADLTLTATLRTRDLPVVGYTIEIFYP